MTVKELIKQLEQIEDKDLPVVLVDEYTGNVKEADDAIEGTDYFTMGSISKIYKCVKIIGG